MELRHLRYFVAVADEMHFTRAAARLGMGQPPLSQQIQQLERELGTPLFLRLPRGIALTDAGRQFLEDSRAILGSTARAADKARLIGRGETGTITVGFTGSSVFHPALARALRAYRDSYPHVHVTLREGNTGPLIESLRRADIDLAFVRPPFTLDADLRADRVVDEPMLIALPAQHPLCARESLALADLKDEGFVLYPRPMGSGLYDAIYAACQRAGFVPRIAQEAPQMASIISLVAAGFGISLVPASMRQINTEGVEFRPLRGDAPRALLDLAYRRHDPSQAAHNAVALMLDVTAGRISPPAKAPEARSSWLGHGDAPQ